MIGTSKKEISFLYLICLSSSLCSGMPHSFEGLEVVLDHSKTGHFSPVFKWFHTVGIQKPTFKMSGFLRVSFWIPTVSYHFIYHFWVQISRNDINLGIYSPVHQQIGQTRSTNCKSRFYKLKLECYSSQIITQCSTPNKGRFANYFWIVTPSRVIRQSLIIVFSRFYT